MQHFKLTFPINTLKFITGKIFISDVMFNVFNSPFGKKNREKYKAINK